MIITTSAIVLDDVVLSLTSDNPLNVEEDLFEADATIEQKTKWKYYQN